MPTQQQILHQLRCLPAPLHEPGEAVPVESDAFRALFPHGMRRGTLTEWLSEGTGSGAEALTLRLVAALNRGVLVVVDSSRTFYAPAASALGISLPDTIVVRPRSEIDSLWTIEQALRCRGVGIVLTRRNHLPGRAFRRLQLAAERGGTIGVLLRPANQRASPSWAPSRFLVRALPSQPHGRRLQIESLQGDCRGVVELEMDDVTGVVRLVSQLAPATAVRRAAGA